MRPERASVSLYEACVYTSSALVLRALCLLDVEEAKRALAAAEKERKRRKRAVGREEERDRRVRERETWSSYQVPIPSRHHAGITVPGCLIGFNRNRQSSAAEFRKETAVLSSSSYPSSPRFTSGRHSSALEYRSTQWPPARAL